MSDKGLVDANGQQLLSGNCEKCGAPDSEQQKVKSFGGHHRVVCMKCGHELNRWREDHVERV